MYQIGSDDLNLLGVLSKEKQSNGCITKVNVVLELINIFMIHQDNKTFFV